MTLARFGCGTVALATLACAGPPAAGPRPVHWTVTAPSVVLAPGGTDSLVVRATLDPGWHVYAVNQGAGGPVPTRITLAPAQPFSLAGVVSTTTAPHTEMDQSFHINVLMHDKSAAFVVPVRAGPSLRGTVDTVHVNARYQACNASLCLPPQTARLAAAVATRAATEGAR